jgi:hypothetical protein
VIDTLEKLGSDPTKYVRTGLLRDDLIGLTVHMIKTQKGVKGDAYRSLLGEAHRYPQLLARFKTQVLAPRFEALTELLRDAAKRGEISPERLTPMVLEVLHALILKHTLLEARDPTKKDITEMIDEVLLPLLVAKPIQQELRTAAAPGRGQDFCASLLTLKLINKAVNIGHGHVGAECPFRRNVPSSVMVTSSRPGRNPNGRTGRAAYPRRR